MKDWKQLLISNRTFGDTLPDVGLFLLIHIFSETRSFRYKLFFLGGRIHGVFCGDMFSFHTELLLFDAKSSSQLMMRDNHIWSERSGMLHWGIFPCTNVVASEVCAPYRNYMNVNNSKYLNNSNIRTNLGDILVFKLMQLSFSISAYNPQVQ